MSVKIKNIVCPEETPFRMDNKRVHLPFQVTATCPKCGTELTQRYNDDHGSDGNYLDYPIIGAPFDLNFYHGSNGPDGEYCGHEFSVSVILEFLLTVAEVIKDFE